MLSALHMIDKLGALDKRMSVLPTHQECLRTLPFEVVLSGPLLAADGETIVGSRYLDEIEDRTDVDSFLDKDPLADAQVWDRIDINRFHRRVGRTSRHQASKNG